MRRAVQSRDANARSLERAANSYGNCQRTRSIAMEAQRVCFDGDARAVNRGCTTIANDAERLVSGSVRTIEHGASLRARHERAIRLIGAIGECLGGNRQTRVTPRFEEGRPREPDQRQLGRVRLDGFGDDERKIEIACRLVVERPMRLYVNDLDLLLCRHGDESCDLLRDHSSDDFSRKRERAAPEALPIDICRMGAHGHTVPACGVDRPRHRLAVARVATAGDVHRRQVWDETELGFERRLGRAFANVSIEIDPHCVTFGAGRRFLPWRADVWRKKEKGTT